MSKKSNYTIDLSNVRTKIKSFQEQGKEVVYSATFVTDGKKQRLVDMAHTGQLSLITRNLRCEVPEKITLELFDKNNPRNPLWVKLFVIPKNDPQPPAPTGLGEAEINQIVDQRMAERQRAREHEELTSLVKELTAENEEYQDRIQQLENENEQMEGELEKKKSIRYYAGMLGDILESFGIRRDKIKKPLAELMGVEDDQPAAAQVEAHREDHSGIVETEVSAEDKKRVEIMDLIQQYLGSLPLMTLAKVFQVFSAIEQSPFVADELIDYLNNRNSTDHEQVRV